MVVIQLHKSYVSKRLNDACQRAFYGNANSYIMVKIILKNNLDPHHINTVELDQTISHIPSHDKIRGASAITKSKPTNIYSYYEQQSNY